MKRFIRIMSILVILHGVRLEGQAPCAPEGVDSSSLACVRAMVGYNDGTGLALYVAGSFQTAGGIAVSNVARWTPNQWQSVGTGLTGGVGALAVHDDGSGTKLYACGSFLFAGQSSLIGVARWDGVSWSPVGNGLPLGAGDVAVFDLLSFDPDGPGPIPQRLYASGKFAGAAVHVWDGTSWSPIAGAPSGVVCRAMTTIGTSLYVGGDANGVVTVWRHDFSIPSWTIINSGLPTGMVNTVNAIAAFDPSAPMGTCGPRVYAGIAVGPTCNNVYELDPTTTTWTLIAPNWFSGFAYGEVNALRVLNVGNGPELHLGGSVATMLHAENECMVMRASPSGSCGLSFGALGQSFAYSDPVDRTNVTTLAAYVESFAAVDFGQGPQLFAAGQFVDYDPATTGSSATGRAMHNVARYDAAAMRWVALPHDTSLGVGQDNSTAATFQVNGVGASGVAGPFCQSIDPLATTNFYFSGPSNATVVLAAGPMNPLHPDYQCLGILDIGTPPFYGDIVLVAILTLNGSGTLSVCASFPGVPPGPFLNLQCSISQAPGSCPIPNAPAFVLTAAHYLSIN